MERTSCFDVVECMLCGFGSINMNVIFLFFSFLLFFVGSVHENSHSVTFVLHV